MIVAGIEFHKPSPSFTSLHGAIGMSGRCVIQSSTQWLTTAIAIQIAAVRKRVRTKYTNAKTAPQTIAITRLCEIG